MNTQCFERTILRLKMFKDAYMNCFYFLHIFSGAKNVTETGDPFRNTFRNLNGYYCKNQQSSCRNLWQLTVCGGLIIWWMMRNVAVTTASEPMTETTQSATRLNALPPCKTWIQRMYCCCAHPTATCDGTSKWRQEHPAESLTNIT